MRSIDSSVTHAKQGELNISMAALTFPAFITISLSVTYGIIDAWFLSKISDDAAASVGGVFSFLAMSAFLLRSFAQAGGIIAGQYIGAMQHEQVSKTFTVSFIINAVLGVAIGSLIYALHSQIGKWLGFNAQLQFFAADYLKVSGIIIFFQALNFCYLVFMAIHGKTLWNMCLIALLNLINISGNYLLVVWNGGQYFSVSSIACTSAVAQMTVLMLSMYLIHFRLGIVFDLHIPKEMFRTLSRAILKIAIPSSLFPVSLQLNLLALVIIIVGFGAEMLATQVYTVNIIMLVVAWASAVAQSAQIYIARFVGAGMHDKARACYKQCIIWGVTGVLIIVSLFYSFSSTIFGLLTNSANILAMSAVLLAMCFILEPFRAINLVTLAALNAAGDAKFPGLLSIVLMWLVGFTLSWFFGVSMAYGLIGIYIGRIIDEMVRAGMVYWRWRSGVWKNTQPAKVL